MKPDLSWAVLAILLELVEGKALRWADDSPSWIPPKETGEPKLIGMVAAAPEPTYMPTPKFDLIRRQNSNNTCGYMNGIMTPASAIVCRQGWDCYPDQRLGVMGCCTNGNNCVVETLCWNSALSASYTNDGGGRIRYCSNSKAPYCAKGVFTGSLYNKYEVLFCDAQPSKTYVVSYFSPQAIITSSSSSSSSASSSSSSSMTSTSTSTTTTTITPTQTPVAAAATDSSSSSSHAGAIAGGVVGGIAAIGLIVLGFVFLTRRKSRDEEPSGSTMPASPYPPSPGNRQSSMMKPPSRASGSISPHGLSLHGAAVNSSPGYPSHPYSNMSSPQPTVTPFLQAAHLQQQPQYSQQYAPPTYQAQPVQQQTVAHELPVNRSGGAPRS